MSKYHCVGVMCVEHGLEYIMFYVQKHIAPLAVCSGFLLVRDGLLGASTFVRLAYLDVLIQEDVNSVVDTLATIWYWSSNRSFNDCFDVPSSKLYVPNLFIGALRPVKELYIYSLES